MAVRKYKSKRKSNGKSARGRNTTRSTTKKTAGRTRTTSRTTTTTPAKLPTIREPLSKGTMIKTITDVTCLGRKDVVAVLDTLTQVIERHVKSGGPGVFVMPGMMKISVVRKPARPARKGINPFTGEEIMIKAKPAHKVVKIRALKKLKEMVA